VPKPVAVQAVPGHPDHASLPVTVSASNASRRVAGYGVGGPHGGSAVQFRSVARWFATVWRLRRIAKGRVPCRGVVLIGDGGGPLVQASARGKEVLTQGDFPAFRTGQLRVRRTEGRTVCCHPSPLPRMVREVCAPSPVSAGFAIWRWGNTMTGSGTGSGPGIQQNFRSPSGLSQGQRGSLVE
jgi:hypothetical protein